MIQKIGIAAYIRLKNQLCVPFNVQGKMTIPHLQYRNNLINEYSIKPRSQMPVTREYLVFSLLGFCLVHCRSVWYVCIVLNFVTFGPILFLSHYLFQIW